MDRFERLKTRIEHLMKHGLSLTDALNNIRQRFNLSPQEVSKLTKALQPAKTHSPVVHHSHPHQHQPLYPH